MPIGFHGMEFIMFISSRHTHTAYMCYDPEQHIPTMRLDTGVFSATTCIHPPGAAQRSMTTRAWFKKLNFLFS